MSYAPPTPKEAAYRLRRLWRLIAFATLLPLIAYIAMDAVQVFVFGADPGRPLAFGLFALVIMAAHVVFFPRVHYETIAVSLVMASLVVLSPLAGTSVLGWIALLIVGSVLLMMLQVILPMREAATAQRPARFASSVWSTADPARAFAEISLSPDHDNVRFRCGPADADGVFPIWEQADPTALPFDDLLPEDSDEKWQNLQEEGEGDAEIADMIAEMEADALAPAFWAVNFPRGPLSVESMILIPNEDGNLEEISRTTYTVTPRRGGCRITEVEVLPSLPWCQKLMMYLTDFAQDGLVFARDALEGRETLSLRRAPTASILTLIGALFMRRQLARADTE